MPYAGSEGSILIRHGSVALESNRSCQLSRLVRSLSSLIGMPLVPMIMEGMKVSKEVGYPCVYLNSSIGRPSHATGLKKGARNSATLALFTIFVAEEYRFLATSLSCSRVQSWKEPIVIHMVIRVVIQMSGKAKQVYGST